MQEDCFTEGEGMPFRGKVSVFRKEVLTSPITISSRDIQKEKGADIEGCGTTPHPQHSICHFEYVFFPRMAGGINYQSDGRQVHVGSYAEDFATAKPI